MGDVEGEIILTARIAQIGGFAKTAHRLGKVQRYAEAGGVALAEEVLRLGIALGDGFARFEEKSCPDPSDSGKP